MKHKFKKTALALSAFLIIANLLAGCGSKDQGKQETSNNTTSATTATTANAESTSVYPIKTDITLKYWVRLDTNLAATVTNFGDSPIGKELEKKTGVKVEWVHPAQGQEKEVFNTLIASGDLPDIIEYDWAKQFPGGPDKAISDGYIIKLNDVFDKYAPNFKKYLSSNAEFSKMIKTDTGNYYVFPMVRGTPELLTYRGPVIRKDWLDDLGLALPETIDDWYNMLKAFKEKKGAEAPLALLGLNAVIDTDWKYGFLTGAFGIVKDFYLDDGGKVKYGPIEPEYKAFLTTMRKWYADGLLDKNFATTDAKTIDANIVGGKSGATPGNAGGGIGKWTNPGKEKDPKYDLAGAPYPVLNKGDKAKFGQKEFPYSTWASAAITSKCKNVEVAAKYLDYAYGEEGHMLFNFGIEGESYNMVDGYPKYTEVITKNPDKLPMAQAMPRYIKASYGAPFIQDMRFLEQYLALPQQLEAQKRWMNTDMGKYQIPLITPTPEESSEMARIMNDVNTYTDEMFLKFIMGTESIDNFDAYVAQVKQLGIDKALSINQGAVERYNSR